MRPLCARCFLRDIIREIPEARRRECLSDKPGVAGLRNLNAAVLGALIHLNWIGREDSPLSAAEARLKANGDIELTIGLAGAKWASSRDLRVHHIGDPCEFGRIGSDVCGLRAVITQDQVREIFQEVLGERAVVMERNIESFFAQLTGKRKADSKTAAKVARILA